MSVASLDPGLYTNVFHVEIPNEPVLIMAASTAIYPELRLLREKIEKRSWSCRVYRVQNRVFGYGEDQDALKEMSFKPTEVLLCREPSLCKRLILEGFVDHLKGQDYSERLGKGRATLFEPESYGNAANGQIQVYRGYDLRVIWWRQDEEIVFGIIVDVRWEIRGRSGERLSPREIAQYRAMRQIARIQEEILTNGQINTEVARLRLLNHILPFIHRNCRFSLPCGGEVKVSNAPIRVILGG